MKEREIKFAFFLTKRSISEWEMQNVVERSKIGM